MTCPTTCPYSHTIHEADCYPTGRSFFCQGHSGKVKYCKHRQKYAEMEAVKNVLANVKGVANFYNSEHHANYKYEGKVFAKDLNKMLKGR